jgi:hypothetical protein
MVITDVLLSGPGSTVDTAQSLHITGEVQGNCGDGDARADFSFHSILSVPGTAQSLQVFGAITRPWGDCMGGNYTGVFQGPGFDGDAVVYSNYGTMPTNVPLNLFTEIIVEAVASGSVSPLEASAVADFRNTVSFPTDGPVFDLPAGYTANSVDGSIVDNRWVPVPAAPAGAQLTAAFLSLLLAQRHHLRHA